MARKVCFCIQECGFSIFQRNVIELYKIQTNIKNSKIICLSPTVTLSRLNRCTDFNEIRLGKTLRLGQGHIFTAITAWTEPRVNASMLIGNKLLFTN